MTVLDGTVPPQIRAALSELRPGIQFTLSALPGPRSRSGARLYVARPAGGGPLLAVKLVPDSPADIATLAVQFHQQRRGFRAMAGDPEVRIPRVFGLSRDGRALIMAWVRGQSLDVLCGASSPGPELLEQTGRWAGAWHASSVTSLPFAADAAMSWLGQLFDHAGARARADLAGRIDALGAMLPGVNGAEMAGAITHRDLNLRNLILTPQGILYAVDFGNTRLDYAIRDLLFVLGQSVVRTGPVPETAQILVLAGALQRGWRARFGPAVQDQRAALAFQRHQALAGLARLPDDLRPGQRLRRDWLLWLADHPEPLFR